LKGAEVDILKFILFWMSLGLIMSSFLMLSASFVAVDPVWRNGAIAGGCGILLLAVIGTIRFWERRLKKSK